MAKVILLCGMVCSGKTTYAQALMHQTGSVCLSCDELMLALFTEPMGEDYDTALSRAKGYLYTLARQLVQTGVTVILDFGFWSRQERDEVRAMFAGYGMQTELHYLKVNEERWGQNIAARNKGCRNGDTAAYPIDEGLIHKCLMAFEEPAPGEADVTVG